MLVGSIRYKTDSGTELFDFVGSDTSSVLYGRISTHSYTGLAILEGDDSEGLFSRRIDIKQGAVKIETTKVYSEEKKKAVPKTLNSEFFLRLGSIIRFAKQSCSKANSTNFVGMQVASGDYVPEAETTYRIPLDEDPLDEYCRDFLGEVTLRMGELVGLSLETDLFEIHMEEDRGIEPQTFYDFKVAINKGFKVDRDYLGFYVAPAVVKSSEGSMYGLYTSLEQIIKNNPDKDYAWLLGRKYYIVDDSMLDEVCAKIMNHKGFVFFDTETTGLKINFKSRIGQADQLVGVVLSITDGESYYFPCQNKCIKNLCNGDHKYFMERYMRPILEGKKLVAHNMSYDWKVAYIYDINANIVHDTLALFKLTLGAVKTGFLVGLKHLAKLILGRDSLELSDMVVDDSWGESDITFADLPYELVRLYANADTDNTLGLLNYALSMDLLHKYNAQRVYDIEITFSLAVAYQEFYGHKVDTENIPKLRDKIDKGHDESMAKMVEIVGYEFNPNSPIQLTRIMYEELGIPAQTDRKSGNLSTNKDILRKLADVTDIEGNVKYPFVVHLLEYRSFKAASDFVNKLPEVSTEDGYIFSSVGQYGTTTGRISTKESNYQSYNDVVKQHIIPRPGFGASDSDYSSVEYRITASMSGQTELIEAFEDPELDYHSYQASRMYNVPYEAVTKSLRKSAKGINFGLPYGMGDESLGVSIYGEASPENTQKAGVLRKKYFIGQEKIQKFFEDAREQSVRYGYTETFYGRRRYYDRTKFSAPAIKRQGGNQKIQGTAADIYKLAIGRLFLRICKEGWLGKALLSAFVHDEVYTEVHESIDPMVWMKAVRDSFEVDIEGFCKLYVGFGFGTSWYEAKTVEIPTKLQIQMESKWGTTGYPGWNGDMRALCDKIPVMIRDYKIEAVTENITAEESQGKTIKPSINTYLFETLSDNIDIARSLVRDVIKTSVSNEEYELYTDNAKEKRFFNLKELVSACTELSGLSVTELAHKLRSEFESKNINSVLLDYSKPKAGQVKGTSDLQDALDKFCEMHLVDRGSVVILNTEIVESSSMTDAVSEVSSEEWEIAEEDTALQLQKLKDERIDTYGLYTDVQNGIVTFRMLQNQAFMTMLQGKLNRDNRGYRVILKDCEGKKLYETPSYCESKNISAIQQMYLTYFRQLTQYSPTVNI